MQGRKTLQVEPQMTLKLQPEPTEIISSPISIKEKKKLLKMAKEFELMPKFLTQVGLGENSDCVMTQFAQELAGGLISRFSSFHNVFKPTAYHFNQEPSDEKTFENESDHNPFSELDS